MLGAGCVSYDYMRHTPSICEVHHLQMTRMRVDAEPGLTWPSYAGTPYPHAYRRAWSSSCTSHAAPPVKRCGINPNPECPLYSEFVTDFVALEHISLPSAHTVLLIVADARGIH